MAPDRVFDAAPSPSESDDDAPGGEQNQVVYATVYNTGYLLTGRFTGRTALLLLNVQLQTIKLNYD